MSTFQNRTRSIVRIKKLVMAALFCALAYAAMSLTSWIKVAFLTFDAKDTIVTIAGLLFGPVYSLAISFVVSLIELITVSDTGFWGFLMNFLSTATFSCSCALIYRYKKNLKGAVIGLVVAALSTTAMMMLLNLLVTPIYLTEVMGVPMSTRDVAALIPSLLLPFNFTKAVMNAALVLMLYKPISRVMKGIHVTESATALSGNGAVGNQPTRKQKILMNVAVFGIGLVLVALSVTVFIVVLDGGFTFGA